VILPPQSHDLLHALIGVICVGIGVVLAIANGGSAGIPLIVIGGLLIARPLWRVWKRSRPASRGERDSSRLTRQAGQKFLVLGVLCFLVAILGLSGLIDAEVGGKIPFLVLLFPAAVCSYGGFQAWRYGRRNGGRRVPSNDERWSP
jgi:hypothetical protein